MILCLFSEIRVVVMGILLVFMEILVVFVNDSGGVQGNFCIVHEGFWWCSVRFWWCSG